jgi:hypothetical protein
MLRSIVRLLATAAPAFRLAALLGSALCAPAAQATCSQFAPLPELYVGQSDDTKPGFDAACTQSSIQAAIDAANCVYGTKIFITHEVSTTGQPISIVGKNITLVGRTAAPRPSSSAIRTSAARRRRPRHSP